MKWLLYIICRISTGDDTSEVLLGTSSHQQKDKSLDPRRCLPALHTLWLQTLRPHSREGVGSAQALKDTQRFADSSNLFNLWLGPGMSTMEWCYGSWQQYLTLLESVTATKREKCCENEPRTPHPFNAAIGCARGEVHGPGVSSWCWNMCRQ